MPLDGKAEVRFRGPNVMPGYWREPELTAAAFDEEGYYRTGDAAKWVDPLEPEKGLLFDGRIAEDFNSFGQAVKRKLIREIAARPVPVAG